ncbi:unnamed protein product [Cylicocyclus nassatus]|uniref:Uncharacterized protein n=1 Tax=Cylicocyclus nassatus TaxID=53992 RepID=A0AA36GXH2_CYLNA|nr:unnamed protein product [Cylicocyclus nassatus]
MSCSQRVALSNIIRNGHRFVHLPPSVAAQPTSSDSDHSPPGLVRFSDVVLPLVNSFNTGPHSLQFSPLLGGTHWVPSLILSGAGPLTPIVAQGYEHAISCKVPKKVNIAEVGVQTDDAVPDLPEVKSALSKEEKAKWELENAIGEDLFRQGDKKNAILRFQAAASHGIADAMNKLAEFLYSGKEVVADKAKALNLWEQAAALGQVDAIYSLAVYHISAANDGDKTADKLKGLRLMRRAAAGGNPHAAFYLVIRYIRDSDMESAKKMISTAARDKTYAAKMRAWTEEEDFPSKFSALILKEVSASQNFEVKLKS